METDQIKMHLFVIVISVQLFLSLLPSLVAIYNIHKDA